MKLDVITLLVLSATALIGQAQPPSSSPTVRDGVFTDAQSHRGEPIYVRECSTCHGATLKGGEGSPPLAGPDFTASWSGKTVGDLFDKIRQTMPAPPEEPGKLTPQQTADVIAHILSVNTLPAGATELPADVQLLRTIRILEK